MARKWFQLVGEDGNAMTSADYVAVDIEEVAAFRKAVKNEYSDSHLAGIAPSDLKVFANGVALEEDPPIGSFGGSKKDALIVQVPRRAESDSRYFIQPNVQKQVEKAVFVIVDEDGEDEDHKGVGMCVFFSPTLAVTCDHNLTEQHTVESVVSLALKEDHSSFLHGMEDQMNEENAMILCWHRTDSVDENQDVFKNQLGFAPVAGISISAHRRHIMYSCPTYAGDSGVALLIKDGFLVGIHLETINVLREEMDRKKTIKDRLNDVEESLDNIARSGQAQGCSGLLVHEFKDVVSE